LPLQVRTEVDNNYVHKERPGDGAPYMKSLPEIPLKRAYSSDSDDLLNDFYISVLSASVEYYRIAGFFSSSSLAIAARGIIGLINNGGSIRLIVSVKLEEKDVEAITSACDESYKYQYVEEKMLKEIGSLENQFIRDHVSALGWMVGTGRLSIRVALPVDERGRALSEEQIEHVGLFHQKVGILKDVMGNILTFSGSINETGSAWLSNIEEFKVFRDWEFSEKQYVEADLSKFERIWTDQSPRVKVLDVPNAVNKRLIEFAPSDIRKVDFKRWYRRRRNSVTLQQHQLSAVESWIHNNMRGILEMATGTGKTFAALACLKAVFERQDKVLAVVSCPYQHLVQQWRREITKFGLDCDHLVVADSSNPTWKKEVYALTVDIEVGQKTNGIVLTTHSTFSSKAFIDAVHNLRKVVPFLIADEVHGLGAENNKNGLAEVYDFRLGLSATPRRWFDVPGTAAIYAFFGNVVYEFSLSDAISTINPVTGQTYLTPYQYLPHFVALDDQELEEYAEITAKIVKTMASNRNTTEEDTVLKMLLFKRANIVKNAKAKYTILRDILREMVSIKLTLVYCSPQQIDDVMSLISTNRIAAHRFTMEEGAVPTKQFEGLSERDYLLEKFSEGKFKVLVAMKCLDEGVDVPQARTAILMSSSGNPREYIQRIGRVIRRSPGKEEAVIHDLIVTPSFENLPSSFKEMEWRIFKKELERVEEIAGIAKNNAKALEVVYRLKNKLLEK
jgi:superfamily II DNA or RNA helicase